MLRPKRLSAGLEFMLQQRNYWRTLLLCLSRLDRESMEGVIILKTCMDSGSEAGKRDFFRSYLIRQQLSTLNTKCYIWPEDKNETVSHTDL